MRSKMPISVPTCRRFESRLKARQDAQRSSEHNLETRYVIHTGDYWFSSTTADIQYYERIDSVYERGVEKVVKRDKRLIVGFQQYLKTKTIHNFET